MSEELNLFLGILGGVASLISIIQLFIDKNPKKKIIYILVLAVSLVVVIFLPFFTLENEISQYGPYFFTVSESESEKIGYVLVKNLNKPFFTDRSISDVPSKVKILAKAAIWSQQNETGSITVVFDDLQGCKRKGELVFSRRLQSDNAQDYRDPYRMEEKSEIIILNCKMPVKELSIFVIPGTWALSVNLIKIVGINNVNLLVYIKNHLFN